MDVENAEEATFNDPLESHMEYDIDVIENWDDQ